MDHMLDLTRIKSGRLSLSPEPILLCDVVQGYVNEIKPVDKQLTIQLEIPGTLRVLADRNGLHDIFINLLSNAFKFTSEGGSISIRAATDGLVSCDPGHGIGILRIRSSKFRGVPPVKVKMGGTGLGLHHETSGGRTGEGSASLRWEGINLLFYSPACKIVTGQCPLGSST
jgi:signal transduction histidine kinase